jgi:hypothetical protein
MYLPINLLQPHSSKVYLTDAILVKSVTFQSDELYQRCLSSATYRSKQVVAQLTTFLFILPFPSFILVTFIAPCLSKSSDELGSR